MREVDAHTVRAIDLGAQFSFDLIGLGVIYSLRSVERKITLRIQQARHLVPRGDWTPAIVGPFAVQGLMHAKVGIWVRFCELHGLRKPRAGDQDARGSDPVLFESFGDRAID